MRALAVVVVASVLAGCAAPIGNSLIGPDRLGQYAPAVEDPPVDVSRTGEADGLVVHVHSWRFAYPDPERVPASAGVRYVVLDVSVRRASPDASSIAVQRFGVQAAGDGSEGAVLDADPLLTKLLPHALPRLVEPPLNVTVRGDVLAPMPQAHEPWRLLLRGAPLVDLSTPGADAAPAAEPSPRLLAPSDAADVGDLSIAVHAVTMTTGIAQHDELAVLAVDYSYSSERVENARGASLGFLLRGTDGRLYVPSVSEMPEWWDMGGPAFEPGREYRDVALMEAPPEAAPFEAWYPTEVGAAVAWGLFDVTAAA